MGSSKLKTVALVILVVAILLGIVGLGFAYYYYKNTLQTAVEEEGIEKYCGCYSVSNTDECSPEKSTEFSVKTGTGSTVSCTSVCADKIPANDYYSCRTLTMNNDGTCPVCPDSSTAKLENGACKCCSTSELKACTGEDINQIPFCQNIVITDQDDKKLTPPFDSQSTMKVTAYFRKDMVANLDYSSFTIKVNNKEETIDATCADNCSEDSTFYMPYMEITSADLVDADTLNITATADSNSQAQASTLTCTRSYVLMKTGQAYCPSVVTNSSDISNLPVSITGLEVPVINLPAKSEITDIKMRFTFTGIQGVESLTTNSLLEKYDSANQKITLDSTYLSTATNFVEVQAFPTIDFPANSTASSLEVKVNAIVIYTVSGEDQATNLACGYDKIRVTRQATQEEETEEEEEVEIPDTTNQNQIDNAEPGNGTPATSRFSVIKTGSTCVERVAPNNSASFEIVVTNADSDSEIVRNVKDKLPLGFTYVANSSVLNGVSFPDGAVAQGVTIETVGNSQQITWSQETGWTMQPNTTLTINFTAIAGDQAITGSNDNEVVIEPNNAPVDATAIRAVHSISVQQTCSAPKTGLLDTLYGRVSLGIIALIMGVLFYYTSTGQKISENVAYSTPMKSASAMSSSINSNVKDLVDSIKLKLIYPREYFEKKIIRDAERGKKKKS